MQQERQQQQRGDAGGAAGEPGLAIFRAAAAQRAHAAADAHARGVMQQAAWEPAPAPAQGGAAAAGFSGTEAGRRVVMRHTPLGLPLVPLPVSAAAPAAYTPRSAPLSVSVSGGGSLGSARGGGVPPLASLQQMRQAFDRGVASSVSGGSSGGGARPHAQQGGQQGGSVGGGPLSARSAVSAASYPPTTTAFAAGGGRPPVAPAAAARLGGGARGWMDMQQQQQQQRPHLQGLGLLSQRLRLQRALVSRGHEEAGAGVRHCASAQERLHHSLQRFRGDPKGCCGLGWAAAAPSPRVLAHQAARDGLCPRDDSRKVSAELRKGSGRVRSFRVTLFDGGSCVGALVRTLRRKASGAPLAPSQAKERQAVQEPRDSRATGPAPPRPDAGAAAALTASSVICAKAPHEQRTLLGGGHAYDVDALPMQEAKHL